ncbi:MAG: tetratricopeptide repeat protein [Anaerolineae bacterium]|nr:tetratricopeptide repeat protein [Anaerolineae bacterium]
MLELTVLGPPHAALDEEPVTDFISSKALILFCYLALEGNRSHARETLAGLLWGEMPEERARSNLRQALHNIQKLFPGYFTVTRQTAAFDISQPHRLDAVTFRELIEHSEVDGAQLEMAVSLYQGEFLDGLYVDDAPALEDWLRVERERHRLLLLSAIERLADHHTLRGEWERAADLVRHALSIEPWREESHRRLMLLLARQGEYNAALAHYEICCQALDDDLGAEPTVETTALYERIQRSRITKRHNLPPAPNAFVGRQTEISFLEQWIRNPDCHLITLVGPGGVGKTRLAQELSSRHAHEFLDGLRWVPLSPIIRPEFIVTVIAEAVEVSISGPEPARDQLIAQLAEREMLLLLDGFEHLMAGVDLISDMLLKAPELTIVVTSREKLNLQEEWVFTVDGLATPPEELQDTGEVKQYDAVVYFEQSARQQKVDFALRGQGAASAYLVRILGGSPLGIELATALLPVASCAQIAAEVEQNLDVLTTAWRNKPERHRSLRAVFDHSWQLLTPHEQLIFPRLSVFFGGFTLEAARSVAGADLHMLGGLVAKSLLRVLTAEGGAIRYEIHEILRQYAEELLEREPAVRQQIETGHIAYYAGFLQQQEELASRGERQKAIDAIAGELGNIRVAWQKAIAHRDVKALGDALSTLHRFYEARSWFQEGNDLFTLAIEGLQPAATPAEEFVWGRLLAHKAGFQLRLGNVSGAQGLAQQGAEVLRRHKAEEPLAFVLNTLGITQLSAGDFAVAKETLQEGLAIYRALGSRREIVAPLANLGIACVRAGDYEAARDVLEEGLAICCEEDIRQGLAQFLTNLGALHCTMGDLAAARHHYEQALPVCEELGQRHLKAFTLINLGEIGVREKDFEQALADCQTGVNSVRYLNDLRNLAKGLKWLGLAHLGLDDEKAARNCLYEGLEIALKIQAPPTTLSVLTGVAVLLLEEEQLKGGVDLLMAVARHPATDQNERAYAVELLANQGITLPDEAGYEEEQPLIKIAGTLLAELRVALETAHS